MHLGRNVSWETLRTHSLDALRESLAAEWRRTRPGDVGRPVFDEELSRRIPLLEDACRYVVKHSPEPSFAYYAVGTFLRASGRAGLPFEEQMRSLKLNARFASRWRNRPPAALGNYLVAFKSFSHFDTPISLEIQTRGGKELAAIGGYVHYDGGRKALRVNNLQGVNFWEGPAKGNKAAHIGLYEDLNRDLGENWRVFLLKEAVAAAREKGLALFAEEPKRYFQGVEMVLPLASEGEYRRQIRQYRQAFRKAGLTKTGEKGVWRLQP